MPRRVKHSHDEHNLERWLISYSDFVTLLFAFFVVMYSISSVNEGKYKVLSETLIGAFNASEMPSKNSDAIELSQHAKNSMIDFPGLAQKTGDVNSDSGGESDGFNNPDLEKLTKEVEGAFSDLIEDDDIAINGNETWVEISLNSNLLFTIGSARPTQAAIPVIQRIADILAGYRNPIHVEGFTDDLPINSEAFPSNWELSAARSATVVRLLMQEGVDPDRMAAVGYAEYQPIADNKTKEGRNQNRRVVLIVSRDLNVRRAVSGVEGLGVENAERQLDLDEAQRGESSFLKERNDVKTVELEDGGLLFTQDE